MSISSSTPWKNCIALYFDQVSLQFSSSSNKFLLKQVLLFSTNLSFSFFVFNPGWKIFSSTISKIFWFFSHISSSSFGSFSLIDHLSGFIPQFSTGLGGFSSATWLFKTYQLLYGARMFLVVSQFSSSVFFIRLGGFSPGSHSSLQWFPHSAELASKGGDNCNNVILRAESFQSKSHVIVIIWNFTLVSLTSITMLYSTGLPFEATVPSHFTHLTTYSTLHYLCSQKVFPVMETICVLSTFWKMRSLFLERYWMA